MSPTAHSRYIKAWKVQNGRQHSVQVSAETLAAVLAGDLDALRMALGPEMVAALEHRAALAESRRRREARSLAAAPEVIARLATPPDPALGREWSELHDAPDLRAVNQPYPA